MDTVYSLIQGHSGCHRCAGRPCFDWGKSVYHELFLIPTYYLIVNAVAIWYMLSHMLNIRLSAWPIMPHPFANTTECNLSNILLLNDWSFIMIFSICLVDLLLHWIWIVLRWNFDQHLGYSGLTTLLELSNHLKHMHQHFECHDFLMNYHIPTHYFFGLLYSKYTCTSAAVGRPLRWNGRPQGEHWGLQYDSSVLWRRKSG